MRCRAITNAFLVDVHVSIKEAMRCIDHNGRGVVFVVGEEDVLRGSVSDGDIRRFLLGGGSVGDNVETIMNKTPVTIEAYWNAMRVKQFLQKIWQGGGFPEQLMVPVCDAQGRIVDMLSVFRGRYESVNGSYVTLPQRKLENVLVVGGAGYIGSVLTRLLVDRGYNVTILDAFLYGDTSLQWAYERDDVRIVQGDTRHIDNLVEAMQGVDAVVHLAELVGDPACARDPVTTLQTNYLATRLVASTCRHLQINRLVYASSCSVYGASDSEELLHEESVLHPVSLYGKMKIESEKALLEMMDENFSPTILRLATVYGGSYRPRFDLVVNTLSAKAMVDKEIPIFGGSQWRPHVHARDVGRAVIAVLESPLEKVRGEIFNTGSEAQNRTIADLGETIQRLTPGAQLRVQEDVNDRRNYRVSFAKITDQLAFLPAQTIEDGIQEIQELLASGVVQDYRDKRYCNHV